jgi:5-methylcytosine-specific restriction endonuclease McrA
MATREERNSRPGRESLRKRLGRVVSRAIDLRDGCRCQYCGATAESSGAPLQLDHLVCRSAGGPDHAHNLVLACRKCNRARSTTDLDAWCAQLGLDADALRAHARSIDV